MSGLFTPGSSHQSRSGEAEGKTRLVLVSTAPGKSRGSMTAYIDLVLESLKPYGPLLEVRVLDLAPPQKILRHVPARFRALVYHLWLVTKALLLVQTLRGRLVHLLDGSVAYLLRFFPKVPVVATCHDIIPYLQLQEKFPVRKPAAFAAMVIRQSIEQLRNADLIITVSESTRRDLVGAAGESQLATRTIYSAIPRAIVNQGARESTVALGKAALALQKYIFHIGNDGFYKNRAGVVRIFNHVRQYTDVRLKMAGPAPTAEMNRLIEELGLTQLIDFVVQPEASEVVDLYRHASLFLFPSLYEGFGWPPLEAMAMGCPVVCSDRASLPEVVGAAALTGDPEDEKRMAELCLSVLHDRELASRLVQQGFAQAARFSLEKMGRELMEAYSFVLGKKAVNGSRSSLTQKCDCHG